ncbi:MAG TPA: sporulation protein, partial [Pseudoxanthomonas sp.]|nr:sporulation protein [Pseudoxanthomonas sp.]
MAARRNKNQARRNGSGNGTPGWMWLVIGVVLAAAAFMIVPGLLKKDGFDPLKPTPNPDAQPPAQIAEADTDAAADAPAAATAEPAQKQTQYEFYDLLPGKEVQMSDAELAASAREEQARE